MKSFKKIALSMVAAMTMGMLVSTPASANTMTVVATTWNAAKVGGAAFDTPTTTGLSSTAAITRPVPEDNKVDNVDVIRFVATVAAGTSVTATGTNATIVTALHSDAAPISATSGVSSLTVATGTGTEALFYVYTKTSAVGTVVISNGPTTLTYYVQGIVGKINSLEITAPEAGTTSSVVTATIKAKDVFNNLVSGKELTSLVVGGSVDTTTATTGTTLTNFGSADFKVTLPTSGTSTLVVSVKNAVDIATAVPGFNTVTSSVVKTISVRDLLAELAVERAAKEAALAAKAAADKALTDAIAKAAADAATAKAAADADKAKALADAQQASSVEILGLKSEVATLKANALSDKITAEKALNDAVSAKNAELAKVKSDNAVAYNSLRVAFNKLARQWNKANPKAKISLLPKA